MTSDPRMDAAELSRRWLDARARCDLDELASLTSPGATWHSPVSGTLVGRAQVIAQVRAGFADTDQFFTETLALERRDDEVVATIRNVGRRHGEQLDSEQRLHLRIDGGTIGGVAVEVDDPAAISDFWAG